MRKNFENTCTLSGARPCAEISQQSVHHAAVASAAHTPSMQPTVLQHVVCEPVSPSSLVEIPSLAASAFSASESMASDDSVAADDDDAAADDDDDDAAADDDDAAAADADGADGDFGDDDDGGHGEEIAAGMSPFGGGSGVLITLLELDFVKPNCFLGLHTVYTLTP